MDDVVADIKKLENDTMLTKLIFNRRHVLKNGVISIIITTQRFTVCPARIRSASNGVFLFDLNKSDITLIRSELLFMDQK